MLDDKNRFKKEHTPISFIKDRIARKYLDDNTVFIKFIMPVWRLVEQMVCVWDGTYSI
jgi:hypothetical protein